MFNTKTAQENANGILLRDSELGTQFGALFEANEYEFLFHVEIVTPDNGPVTRIDTGQQEWKNPVPNISARAI